MELKIFNKHGNLIVIGLGIVILLIAIPITVNILADNMMFKGTAGQFNSWLGFWGSYIGGIISGALTLGGVYLGLRHERNYSLFTRYYTNTKQYEDFLKWVEDTKRVSSYSELDYSFLKRVKESMFENGTEKMIEGISRVDLEMYKLGRDIEYAMDWLSIHLEQLEKGEEESKWFAKQEIPKEIAVIEAKAKEVDKRNLVITKIVNKYS